MPHSVNIVADIGGTNARFAYLRAGSDKLLGVEVFPCANFPSFADAIHAYITMGHVEVVEKICLAVAAPIESDWIDLPNNHWAFSRTELQQSIDATVVIINDFSAQVLCLDSLPDSSFQWIGSARPKGNGIKAVIGPGTGLGISAITPSGDILPSEGGHVTFAPSSEHEVELLKKLWQRYDRVSVERLLSGMGLANLYWANCQLNGGTGELSAAEVTAGAYAGEKHCLQAVTDFLSILAVVSGDVALMIGANDGVYLSGGILPRLLSLFDSDEFRRHFDNKGRYSELCSTTPLAIVLAENPGLVGCVAALKLTK
ncbi:MAG: glucokinase [Oceanicoccus sp.]